MKQMSRKRKRRRRYRRKIGVTTILVVIFAMALCLGVFAIHLIRESKKMEMPMAYDTETLSYTKVIDSEIQSTKGLAADLCVTNEDVPNANISLDGNSIGGLFNLDSNEVVFSKSAFDRVYPASITKIMTAILAEKYGNMDDVVTIAAEDVDLESGSQVIGFREGDRVSLYELYHGLLVYSGNDAAMAIARHIGGTVEDFVTLMNEEAHALGCFDTHFMNPSGLHDASHYTSVYDVYLMLKTAVEQYPLFSQVMQLSVYDLSYVKTDGSVVNVNLDSTDKYLTKQVSSPKGITVLGGKTGTTSLAGNCLAIVSQNSYGEPYISIILRAATKDTLYAQMNMLLTESNQ